MKLKSKKPASSTVTSGAFLEPHSYDDQNKPADSSEDFVSDQDDETGFNFDKTLDVTPGNTSFQALLHTPVRHPASQKAKGVKRPIASFSSMPHKISKVQKRRK